MIAFCCAVGAGMASPSVVDFVVDEETVSDAWAPNRDAWREIGGALVSGAVIGAFILLWEEHLERARERREDRLATEQAERDEWTALLIQLAGRTELDGLNMAGRDLHNIVLDQAKLRGSVLGAADLQSAYLTGADLTDADLLGTDLRYSTMTSAVLVGAKLVNTKLAGADLRNADLSGVDLSKAKISRTDFDASTDADVALLRLSEGKDRRTTLFADATFDDETTWPPGLGPSN